MTETTTFRGVRWRREPGGAVSFFDDSTGAWVRWEPGVDAPPLPPRWGLLGVATTVSRPGWRSRWRLIPIALVLAGVALAVAQVLVPSGSQASQEAKAAEALLGKCLPRTGTAFGHPSYSAKAVACGSPQAAVKVLRVVPTTPGSPTCPVGTTGMELPYVGVAHPHVLCVAPLRKEG
jgi:hypothetical protein